MKTKWVLIPAIALTLGCTREIDRNVKYIDGQFSLFATSGEKETKTVIQQDGNVFWSPNDCIKVYYGNTSGEFISTNTEPAASAEFTGSLGSFVLDGETEFKAVYPYSEATTLSGDILSIVLPYEQTAVEETFANNLFISVAKSKDVNLHFYNVCGGICFSLARNDIKKVVFKGNNGEFLAGRLSVGFASNGAPQVTEISYGTVAVTLLAPDNGTFAPGSWYYLVLVPQALTKGYTMELYTDELVETISSYSSVTVRRSAWGVLKNLGDSSPSMSIPEAINLGLSVKWASFNLGASKPEEYGDYYAWGETNSKDDYSWTTYKWCMGSGYTLTKYCSDSGFGYNGFTDTKTVLDSEDDAAHVKLGEKWRMPTDAEWTELRENCTWTWIKQNGVNGYLITGPNGNSIFLPAAGNRLNTSLFDAGSYGIFWSSSLDTVYPKRAWYVYFSSNGVDRHGSERGSGFSVRPVNGDVTVISVTGVSLDKTSLSMTVGDTQTLTATVTPSNATNKSVTWSSSNTSVASISSSGVITPKAAGSATITVTTNDGGKKATCSVTVKEKTVSVTGVSLDKTSLSLTEGDTYPLSATISPSNATDKTVTWSSSNTSVATVSSSGIVTAKATGSSTITVKTNDGAKTATCSVTVTKAVLEAIDLGLSVKWASFNLGATRPEGYGDYYAWGETDPYYSSQDPLAWKTGKEAGYDWVSYKWCMGDNNTMTKYCNKSDYGYNGFTDTKTVLDSEDDAAKVNLGDKWRMPTDAEWMELRENCTWTWTTENGVNGRLVTAPNGNSIFLPAAGFRLNTYLSSVGSNGRYWSSSLCTVYPDFAWSVDFYSSGVDKSAYGRRYGFSIRPVSAISVTGVSLGMTSLSMTVGDTKTLTATVTPSNATDKAVTWSSSNTSVATVSSSGVVTARSAGNATITVTTNDGAKTATCYVSVHEAIPVTGVSLNTSSLNMIEGETQALNATVIPSNATNTTLNWLSSDNSVATVSSGLVTAKNYGTATITVKTSDNTVSATCTVTVFRAPVAVDLGLSVKWSSVNITHKKQDGMHYYEGGTRFAWGEITEKKDYRWNTYKWSDGSGSQISKYNTLSDYGQVDNITVLQLEDDAAYAILGGKWRIPTREEFQELIDNCDTEWKSDNGVYGLVFTSRINGNSIVIPEAPYLYGTTVNARDEGYYWTSSLNESKTAYWFTFGYHGTTIFQEPKLDTGSRFIGCVIRPVCD